jgi:cobalt-zinc-cadmium efflux system protein
MHNHEHDTHSAGKIGWTVLLNLIITVAEYFGGTISGSLALLSDAGHNFSDVLSLILGYVGEKVSHTKPTTRNSFGLKRFEILAALINALALWGVGFLIIVEAIKRLNSPENITFWLMLVIAVIGLLGNLCSVLILNKDKDSSLNMKAAYLHMFYDTLSSVLVIISAIIIYLTKWTLFDLIASAFIAVMIVWSGFGIIKDALNILMQGVPGNIDPDKVYASIAGTAGVASVHGLHIWSVNSNEVFLSCHVCIDCKKAGKNSDSILKSLNRMLDEKYGIEHTTIQA